MLAQPLSIADEQPLEPDDTHSEANFDELFGVDTGASEEFLAILDEAIASSEADAEAEALDARAQLCEARTEFHVGLASMERFGLNWRAYAGNDGIIGVEEIPAVMKAVRAIADRAEAEADRAEAEANAVLKRISKNARALEALDAELRANGIDPDSIE